jgi:hypothetical protein
MANLVGRPIGNKLGGATQVTEEDVEMFSEKASGGINTWFDPADLKPDQTQSATNMRIYGDIVFSREGSSDDAFAPQGAIPNVNPILNVVRFARFDGTAIFVRFDKDEIWRRAPASWEEITGAGFIVNQRQKTLAINDRFFFTSGTDEIQEINFTADTYADLGNAPKYKYICGFFNRIIGANLFDTTSPNPTQVGWSGDLNFAEWSALVDISAGNVALVEGQGDFSDEITGLFGFASVMLILRERSLWTATKRPVATLPFQFTASYPNVGCDSPDSAAQTSNGIAWYDYRSNQVYTFEIGNSPVPIGTAIRKDLGGTDGIITDNLTLQGSFDPKGNRYHLCIPSDSSTTTIVYVFDYDTATWVKDERYLVNGVFPIDEILGELVYDDLVGVYDDLIGVYDDLSDIDVSPSTITYGLKDGVLLQDDSSMDTDNGVAFTADLVSKIFELQKQNISVTKFLLKYRPKREGTFDVLFSRNGGKTFETYKTITISATDIGQRKILTCYKNITTSEYVWKLSSTIGSFEVLEYRILGIQTTDTREK